MKLRVMLVCLLLGCQTFVAGGCSLSGTTYTPPAITSPTAQPSIMPTSPTTTPDELPSPSPSPSPKPVPANLKIVGYISYWQFYQLPKVHLEQLTHLIWQGVQVNSATDPGLHIPDGYPEAQIAQAAIAAHARGIKVLVSLCEPWNNTDLNQILELAPLRAQLITNLVNLVQKYDLDGIDIDIESSLAPEEYSKFISELYNVLKPMDKIISITGHPFVVNIEPASAAYLEFISLMTYDMGKKPGYPYHSIYEESVEAMELWETAGVPKTKLLMGVPFYGRDSDDGFYFYYMIVLNYNPSPGQNEVNDPTVPGGIIWFNGIDLARQKVDYIKTAGFGGVMVYEVGTDRYDDKSLLGAIFDEICKPNIISSPTAAGMTP